MRAIMQRLIADRAGASAAELALAFPLLMLLLMPAIDLALGFRAQMRLTAAASRAAELATGTGRVFDDYEFLKAEAQASAGDNSATASITNGLECNDRIQSSSIAMCPGGEHFARYLRISVQDNYVPLFNYGGFIGPSVALEGAVTVRVQ
jgi:hypothetical protein